MIAQRRAFLVAGAALGTSGLVGLTPLVCGAEKEKPAEDVSAAEDLMREHGVLRRILLIYDEGLQRMREKPRAFPSSVMHRAAALVRTFVEDYHEKLEENFLFPEFEKSNRLVPLVKVLREQHEAGRRATEVMQQATAVVSPTDEQLGNWTVACEGFIRMYRPHAAPRTRYCSRLYASYSPPHNWTNWARSLKRKRTGGSATMDLARRSRASRPWRGNWGFMNSPSLHLSRRDSRAHPVAS